MKNISALAKMSPGHRLFPAPNSITLSVPLERKMIEKITSMFGKKKTRRKYSCLKFSFLIYETLRPEDLGIGSKCLGAHVDDRSDWSYL